MDLNTLFTCLYVYTYICDVCCYQLLAVSCARFAVIMDYLVLTCTSALLHYVSYVVVILSLSLCLFAF